MKLEYKKPHAKAERNMKIYEMKQTGKSAREVGEEFGISRGRVFEIVNDVRRKINWHEYKKKENAK